MKKKNILVVCGGTSSEREISLKSGKACSHAMKKLKYKVINFDPAKEDLKKIKNYKVDVIFNALHGRDGEDGIAQSYFEYFKIPYTHSGILSSMNSMDKITSKKIFKKHKIRTPSYIELNPINYLKILKEKNISASNLTYPLVLKPSNEGSSIGVKICKNFYQLKKSIVKLIKKHKINLFNGYMLRKDPRINLIKEKFHQPQSTILFHLFASSFDSPLFLSPLPFLFFSFLLAASPTRGAPSFLASAVVFSLDPRVHLLPHLWLSFRLQ